MMGKVTQLKVAARQRYLRTLQNIEAMIPLYDVAGAAIKYWAELTGASEYPACLDDSITMSVHLSHLKPNGRFPTREYDVAMLVEFIDERLESLGYTLRDPRFDEASLDFTWAAKSGGLRFNLWAYHGGNCTLKQVGTETRETPVYEMKCL
jgi:hypothetical protein